MAMVFYLFSSRRRHTRCALVAGVQTCALPIYLPKPFDLKELVGIVQRALIQPKARRPIDATVRAEDEQLPLIGRSAAMQEIYRVLARLMGTNLTVMIAGESGTGKELFARALADYATRRGGSFVPPNIEARPP